MAKINVLDVLYSKERSPLEFKFDSMWMRSLYEYLTPSDIQQLHYLASSAKFSSKIEYKYQEMDKIMKNRGFKRFHCGTNRVVYSFLEDESFLVKVAIDRVGLKDNPAEYKNQFLLKPFVTKVFQVSPCGTVATCERVIPITSRQEFMSVATDVFELLNEFIIGKYVLEDIGTKYFMNWGIRKGFGVVLLDFPYVFELDGNKLYCNNKDKFTGATCGGVIDYDEGFNELLCSRCGKHYNATELEQSVKNKVILVKDDCDSNFKIKIIKGDKIVTNFEQQETDYIIRK